MDPNKQSFPLDKQSLPADAGSPLSPGMPEPLNTAAQAPTQMPMGSPTPPLGRSAGEGLPAKAPGSKKIIIAVIILLILGVLGVGSYYFYTMPKTTDTPQEKEDNQPEQDFNVLGTELDSIEVIDPEGDLAEVDKEIALLEATPSSK